jgi:hypothetical protein
MSQDTPADHISKKRVVYQIPNMHNVMVRSELEYRTTVAGPLTMDLYYPPDAKNGARLPVVVFIAGYPDPKFQKIIGCRFKDLGAYTSWGRLMAASGMVAATYSNRDPVMDAQSLLQYIRTNANQLGIDEHRIGLWACSGNVPLALSILMNQGIDDYVKCAVLSYGFMLDLDGSDIVVDAAKMWGFVNACAGKSVDDLPRGVSLLIVRAGLDQMPHLNETIDQFLRKALSKNLPITLANHAAAPHAFDLLDDSDLTREFIRGILAFMRFHLLGSF